MLRTTVPADNLDAAGVVTAYKNLNYVERDFRTIKADDLDLRPIHHRLEDRVRAHVLICMLAAYLTWHLRRALGAADLHRRTPARPATTPSPPPAAPPPPPAKPPAQHDRARPARPQLPRPARPPGHPDPQRHPLRPRHAPIVPTLTVPTPTQRRAFELIDTAIPLNPEVDRTQPPQNPANPLVNRGFAVTGP